MNILLTTDSYKTSHHKMLPKGTTLMYGNWTPRSLNYAPKGITKIVSFGQQMVIKWLHDEFDKFFANKNAVSEARNILSEHLNIDYDTSHFEKLHKLGYLPMIFKAIPEGLEVSPKVPLMTWYNTHSDFAWLPLYLETVISNMLWKPMTSAAIALQYRRNAIKAVKSTDINNLNSVDFMIHDFSSRGMSSVQSSMLSGAGFLVASKGTDNLPAIQGVMKYYNEAKVPGYSVFASEHSVSSACISAMGEKDMISYYMKQYPKGILSIVSDTLDLTKLVRPDEDGYLYQLKNDILSRDGKLVIRPDSNPKGLTPVDIICGHDNELSARELEADYPEFYKLGLIECLWQTFGGTTNEQGYKVFNISIGALYGEAIDLDRQIEIYSKLKDKGFAATNIALGIGSYTMNMNSRDTLGFAAKATYTEVKSLKMDAYGASEGREIFKDPITDDGTKKSLKGLLKVYEDKGKIQVADQQDWKGEGSGLLRRVYENGKFIKEFTFAEIRNNLNKTSL